MTRTLDPIEREYLRAIQQADTDHAYELSVGLREYREHYKVDDDGED